MSVFVPRTRVVGVRLSAEEFSALEKFSIDSGARSMSEVARKAITNLLSGANRKGGAAASNANRNPVQVKNLEEQLKQLIVEVELLKSERTKPAIEGQANEA